MDDGGDDDGDVDTCDGYDNCGVDGNNGILDDDDDKCGGVEGNDVLIIVGLVMDVI